VTREAPAELVIDEHLADDGTRVPIALRIEGDEVLLVELQGARRLPPGAIEAVFARFAGELADDVAVPHPGVTLPGGARLRPLRHLAAFDVIARDYLVLEPANGPATVVLGVTVAGALRHLARALERNAP
jgi:hypothetical protein